MIEQKILFWRWFAQEGFDQIKPFLVRDIPSEVPKVKKEVAQAMLRYLNVPGDNLNSLSS